MPDGVRLAISNRNIDGGYELTDFNYVRLSKNPTKIALKVNSATSEQLLVMKDRANAVKYFHNPRADGISTRRSEKYTKICNNLDTFVRAIDVKLEELERQRRGGNSESRQNSQASTSSSSSRSSTANIRPTTNTPEGIPSSRRGVNIWRRQ